MDADDGICRRCAILEACRPTWCENESPPVIAWSYRGRGVGDVVLSDVLTVVLAVVSAVLVGFVTRRVLETPVGWPRSIVVGLLVFATGLPFARWVTEQTGLVKDGTTEHLGHALIVIGVVALAIAWVFALGVAVLVCSEVIFPTRKLVNPIDMIKAALQRRKRTRRYFQIVTIASRHGAGWLLHPRSKTETELNSSQQRADAIVDTINESGVTFVKLGQVLSTRRDLIPEPYLSALASLQSSATTLSWDQLSPTLETQLGAPITTQFASIDPEPLAAASLAQVHRGVLVDGTPVVVKIQRPHAREQVEADVDIILRLAHKAETSTEQGKNLQAESVARGFTTTLLEELDYRVEATNTEILRNSLRMIAESDSNAVPIAVPVIYATLSGEQVITMDLMDGVPLSRASKQLAALDPEERDALATGLMSTVIEQILVHGVFHADLHPGNVLLREDGTLGLIDFGAIGVIERSARQHLTALMLAAASEDDVAAVDALLQVVNVPPGVDLDAFRHDVGVVLTTEKFLPRGSGSSSIFSRMIDIIRQHRIALPEELASAFRSFATLEGCLKVIEPEFSMFDRALELVPKLMRKMINLKQLATSVEAQGIITAGIVRELPRRVDTVLSGLENGTTSIGLRTFADSSDRRFVRSLVSEIVGTLVSIAAVVLAIVLIVSEVGPMVTPQLYLFDLLGALLGFFGFLGLLRVVRQIFARRRD